MNIRTIINAANRLCSGFTSIWIPPFENFRTGLLGFLLRYYPETLSKNSILTSAKVVHTAFPVFIKLRNGLQLDFRPHVTLTRHSLHGQFFFHFSYIHFSYGVGSLWIVHPLQL